AGRARPDDDVVEIGHRLLDLRRAGDRLDPEILAETGNAVLDAVAADAVAAERCIGGEVERIVDVHRPGPQPVGHRPGAVLFAWVEIRRQTQAGGFGDAPRVYL